MIYLNQETYIQSTIQKFGLTDANRVITPLDLGTQLEKSESVHANLPYRELLGSLMYIMIATRPDICFAVSYLTRFANSYDHKCWR